MYRTVFSKVPASLITKSTILPLNILNKIQLGIIPPLSIQRGFLLEHCDAQLQQRGITEAKLLAMDGRLCSQLLKQLVYERYLSIPFRVFTFDMEFTGLPVFTPTGPTEDITELGLYSPSHDKVFSCLVQPVCGRPQRPEVAELTHITDKMLAEEGLPFTDAWSKFLDFVNMPEPNEKPGSDECILLLSHGGKLADISLIKWTLEKFKLELPSRFVFGDTIHLIRDAHRCRPVTVDKHPASWKLGDLVQWLRIPPTLPAHRAGNDAKMTWDALYHTLLRYGNEDLSPREQLVSHFFNEKAKHRMRSIETGNRSVAEEDECFSETDISSMNQKRIHEGGHSRSGALELDFDDIFKDSDALKHSPPITEFVIEDSVETDEPSMPETLESHLPQREQAPHHHVGNLESLQSSSEMENITSEAKIKESKNSSRTGKKNRTVAAVESDILNKVSIIV
ncbi:unnamed protein product [Phytomonas sp. Hart1]|nr:unnamed protein product [Phytomonas sp. Hart1]|eukprot:CCW70948.1 unnamed protein product [Phytomonas sp. isolate Hart1]